MLAVSSCVSFPSGAYLEHFGCCSIISVWRQVECKPHSDFITSKIFIKNWDFDLPGTQPIKILMQTTELGIWFSVGKSWNGCISSFFFQCWKTPFKKRLLGFKDIFSMSHDIFFPPVRWLTKSLHPFICCCCSCQLWHFRTQWSQKV